ncbi:hypothetical protein Tco_1113159 [Tanacetum coccineum]|uniref:Monodehydroascorbate reductase n=1 Tax=Tanacetum coccineum TaxID=301880 RepID=A0ABQ5IRX8_9ASTR
MDREVRSLKRSRISLVKVCWNSKRGLEFTWEYEDLMRSKYPWLFDDRAVEPVRNKMAEENIPPLPDLMISWSPSRLAYLMRRAIFSWIYINYKILEYSDTGAKSDVYSFQLDEQWFPLNDDLLRKALEITPVDPAYPFVSLPAGKQIMEFVNELGYPKVIHFISKMHLNNLYQQWRVMLTLINQCLSGKTSGSDKPRHPVLQMMWGIVTRSDVDYAELLWEEFVQGIQTFFSYRVSLSIPSKKSTPHVIPYCQFTKLIIYYLGSIHNIHRRPESSVYVTGDDFPLGNLKFVSKGEKDEVFGKPIPKDLITEAIQQSPYYQQYLEMADRKSTAKESVKKKTVSPADKSKKLAPAKQTKHVKEKSTKPTPLKKADKDKVRKVRKGKSSLQLVDEDEKAQPEPEPQMEDDEYNLQRGIQMCLESRAPVTDEASTGPLAQPENDTSANIVRDTPSPPDVEISAEAEISDSKGDTEILNVGDEKGEDVSNTVALEERSVKLDEGQAGSDPGNTLESRPPPDEDQAGSNLGPSHVALAGPNPDPMHEDFIVTIYPKNLDHAFTYGDQFLYDKPTEEEPGKANMETEVKSMVTIPIHQASSTDPPLSTPVIDLTQPKLVSPPNQEPTFTATTTTRTTTLPPPPPPQQQSTTDLVIVARVSALEQICANFKKKNKYINENVKEAIQNALKAPPEHTALYDALEASIDRDNRQEFIDETAKSCKRHRNDQDPLSPPSKDLDKSKKKRHDSDASASQQTQPINDVSIPDYVHLLDSEDSGVYHLPKIKTRPDWLKPIPEEEKSKTLEPDWIGKLKLTKADLEGPAFKLVRPLHKNNISLQFQMEECHLLLTDKIDLTNLEGNQVVPDISKPLPLGGPPGQIESERDYDISVAYGISHWWFKRKEFYITRHNAPSDRRAVRSHMKILSVVSLKTFSKYGYTYLKDIVLRRADYQDYKILEADFKNLHPNDFEDVYLLHLQGKLNHLSRSDKVSLFNAVNLWIRNIVIRHHLN